jgi:nitrogen fixation/metabolism regulation signal transduction histidine kinase
MTLRNRAFAAGGVIVVVVAALGAMLGIGASNVHARHGDLELVSQQLQSLLEMQSATDRLISEAAGFFATDSAAAADVRGATELVRARRMRLLETSTVELEGGAEDEGEAELNRVRALLAIVDSVVSDIGAAMVTTVDTQQVASMLSANRHARVLDSLIAREILQESAEREENAAIVAANVAKLQRASLILPIAALVILLATLVPMMRRFHFGMGSLLDANRRVAGGDLSAVVPESGRDEFTQLFAGFNHMVGELRSARRDLVDVSRRAGMAEVAAAVLHNIGNVLNNVNVSVTMVQGVLERSKAVGVRRVAGLLQENRGDLATFLTADPRGARMPEYIGALGDALDQERTELMEEVASLRRDVEHISRIVDEQQVHARVATVVDRASLTEVVDAALRISGVERAGITVQREPAPLPTYEVDRHEVLQILVNVFTNARHAILASDRADGRVVIRANVNNGAFRLSVEDNGIGIPTENLTRIFQHGFTTRPGGRGFGLHASANMAKAMGGSLKCSSEGSGRGAVFHLELPPMAQDRAA